MAAQLDELAADDAVFTVDTGMCSEQVKGFARSAPKTVLGGGVGQMINLARANLRNLPRP